MRRAGPALVVKDIHQAVIEQSPNLVLSTPNCGGRRDNLGTNFLAVYHATAQLIEGGFVKPEDSP